MLQQGVLPGFDPESTMPTAYILRALVRSYDAIAHTASLQPLQSLATFVHGVAVSRDLSSLTPGDRVLVLLLDQHNPEDAVVLCRY